MEAVALKVVLYHESRSLGIERIRVLLDQRLRKIVDVLGQTVIQVLNDFQTFFSLFEDPTTFATNKSSKGECASSDSRRRIGNKFAVEQGDLHQEASDVLNFGFLDARTTADQSEPSFRGRVTDSPLNRSKDMLLHLNEGRLIVRVTTDMGQILDGGHSLLGILELGRDPQGSAADKLIMLDVHNPAGDISVDDVQSEVESFWTEAEGEMDLDEEINEARTHVPSNFRLLIHRGR